MAGEDPAVTAFVEDVPSHPSRKVSEDGPLFQDKEISAMYANAAAATGKRHYYSLFLTHW